MSLPPVGGPRSLAPVSSDLSASKPSNPPPPSNLRSRQVSPIDVASDSAPRQQVVNPPGQGQSKGAQRRRARREAAEAPQRQPEPARAAAQRQQQPARQPEAPLQDDEGAGVTPTPPRDEPEEESDARKGQQEPARQRPETPPQDGEGSAPRPQAANLQGSARERYDAIRAARAAAQRQQQPARQPEAPLQDDEGAGVTPTPPRDEPEEESDARNRPLPTPPPADDRGGPGGPPADGGGWRFWRWAGRTGARPAAPPPAAPAGEDGPPPSWLDWMRSPTSDPIPTKVTAPKLGLADFPGQEKKDDFKKKMTNKTECLEPLADMFMYRDTLLKSVRAALTIHAGNPKLLSDNRSEIEKAMKQELAFKELCECGLEEYRWKPWPLYRDDAGAWRISPEVVKTAEKLHEECVKKQGELDRL